MNFDISDDLRAVQDSLSRLLADHWTGAHRTALAGHPAAYAERAWQEMAAMGLAGLCIPEHFGGAGMDATAAAQVLQATAGALAPVPFLSSGVLSAAALLACDDSRVKDELLPAIAAGALQVACTHQPESAPAACTVRRSAAGPWQLQGTHAHLPYGASADWLILPARTTGQADAPVDLFLVAANAPGVQLRPHRLIDGTPAVDVQLVDTAATPLCEPGGASARRAVQAVQASGIAGACAEMVGAMDAAIRMTVDYVKTRKQFGRAIGDNQALRHRLAEMLVALEMSRSLSLAAAVATRQPEGAGRLDLHRAKYLVGRNARQVCQAAIQLHGGIGMTEEYTVGHYLRRVHVLDHQFGDAGHHLQQLAGLA